MTEKALKKILTQTVMKQFPEIDDILVIGDFDDLGENRIKQYKVFFGITPENISRVDTAEIRERIKDYSSYILNPKKEKLGSILSYNPNN